MDFQLCTPSLPLAVVSHDSQRMKANATIVWNNAGFNPFESQKELPWIQVNCFFLSKHSKVSNKCAARLFVPKRFFPPTCAY